jgi:hypothetical protein
VNDTRRRARQAALGDELVQRRVQLCGAAAIPVIRGSWQNHSEGRQAISARWPARRQLRAATCRRPRYPSG